jgi:long-subunit fatty acid transport protein
VPRRRSSWWGAAALLLATSTVAQAGALDRTLQPVGVIFEDGSYAELSYGFTSPEVSGTATIPGLGAFGSGNVRGDFSAVTLSFKVDVSDRVSVAIVVEQPFGADVDYGDADPGYPIAGSSAEFRSSSVTVLGRYEINESFSVHGGARHITTDADLFVNAVVPTPAGPGLLNYDADYESDSDTAFVVGAAYERPEIALRVALTYASETEFSNDLSYSTGLVGAPGPETEGTVEYTLPQTLTLDVRTGIAANTLLFGQIRWADWSETEIISPEYAFNPVVDYEEDVYTYTLGLGRQVTDQLSAAASVIYEAQTSSDFDPAVEDSGVSNLAPTDGQLGLQLAGTYLVGHGLELSGGVRYTRLGDATTRSFGAEFESNNAVSVGLRVGYRF